MTGRPPGAPAGAEPPAGVVLHAPDGTEIACTARWVGRNAAGTAIWQAVPAVKIPRLTGAWRLTAVLPERTRLMLDGPWTGPQKLESPP